MGHQNIIDLNKQISGGELRTQKNIPVYMRKKDN